MKWYLAARYSRRAELISVMHRLEAMGQPVTSRWLREEHYCGDKDMLERTFGPQRFAIDDYQDVWAATGLILFTDPLRTPTRGGKQVELGLALAWSKRIIIVGPPENVFHHMPACTHVADTQELFDKLLREN